MASVQGSLHSFTMREPSKAGRRRTPWYTKPNAKSYKKHRKAQLKAMVDAKRTRGRTGKKPPFCGTSRSNDVISSGSVYHVHNTQYGGYPGQPTKCEGIHTKVSPTRKSASGQGFIFSMDMEDPVKTARSAARSRPTTAGSTRRSTRPPSAGARGSQSSRPALPRSVNVDTSRSSQLREPVWNATTRPATTIGKRSSHHIHNTLFKNGYPGANTKALGGVPLILTQVDGRDTPPSSYVFLQRHRSKAAARVEGNEATAAGSSKMFGKNLASPERTVGKDHENSPGKREDWRKDKDYYRHNSLPINIWDDVHHTPKTGKYRTHVRSVYNIKLRAAKLRAVKEHEQERKRVELQIKRQITRQKLMDRKVARAVLEEMSGQLRHTQRGAGPLGSTRPVTTGGTRSDGFGGLTRLVDPEDGDGPSADEVYSETAMKIAAETLPASADPTDRLAVLVDRPDHLTQGQGDYKLPKFQQKTWRSYSQTKGDNAWNNVANSSKLYWDTMAFPDKDRFAVTAIQRRQFRKFEAEEATNERRRMTHDDIRERFFRLQQQNFRKELETNPSISSRPPTARSIPKRSRSGMPRRPATASAHTSWLAQPKVKRNHPPEVYLQHRDMRGLVNQLGDLQQRPQVEYSEDRDRVLLETARLANKTRTRPSTANAALQRPTTAASERDVEEAINMNDELDAFEDRLEDAEEFRGY